MKEDAVINYIWKKVLFLFVVNFIVWLAIWSIDKYEKTLPETCYMWSLYRLP